MDLRKPEKLECVLRGDRDYIQGSQILNGCALRVNALHPNAQIVSCKLAKITTVELYCSEQKNIKGYKQSIGRVDFNCGGQLVTLHVMEKDDSRPVNRVIDSNSTIKKIEFGERFSGKARTDYDGSTGAKLASLVEVVKSLHSRSSPNSEGIWFTGLLDSTISIHTSSSHADTLKIESQLLSVRRSGTNMMTSSHFKINDRFGNLDKGVILFRYIRNDL